MLIREPRCRLQNFGQIAVEDLNMRGLSAGILAKAVHDAGWFSFLNMLSYKADNAGRQLIKVDAKYTAQECPNCLNHTDNPLSAKRGGICEKVG